MTQSRPFYEEFGWAYDLLIGDPVQPWVDAVCSALAARGVIPPARVLDAGCGTGRHAAQLAERGHVVTLVDSSPTLLELARGRLPGAVAVLGDLRTLQLGASFDAVVCRGVLNDLIDDGDRESVLQVFARHLRADGVLVLDVRDRDSTARRYRDGRTAQRRVPLPGGALTFIRRGDMDGQLLRVHERHELCQGDTRRVVDHEFAMRPWTPAELEERLARTGFCEIELGPGAGRPAGDRLLCTASRAG